LDRLFSGGQAESGDSAIPGAVRETLPVYRQSRSAESRGSGEGFHVAPRLAARHVLQQTSRREEKSAGPLLRQGKGKSGRYKAKGAAAVCSAGGSFLGTGVLTG